MTNSELQDAIMYAHSAVRVAAPTSPVFGSLVSHLQALLAEQQSRAVIKDIKQAPRAVGWTGNADADLALVLLDRLDDEGEGNAERIEQLEELVRKLAADAKGEA